MMFHTTGCGSRETFFLGGPEWANELKRTEGCPSPFPHHTGNAGNIDSPVVNLGQFCPGTVESRGVRVEEERSTGERSRQECCGGWDGGGVEVGQGLCWLQGQQDAAADQM